MRINFYFDSDGTLFEWNNNASLEEVATKGYFANRPPHQNVIDALLLLKDEDNISVNILSSTFTDTHSAKDKTECFKKNGLENIPAVFIPYGEPKYSCIHTSKNELNILVDDYTPNCLDWKEIAIKIYNGINGTKGRWHGYRISNDMSPEMIRNTLLGIAKEESQRRK